MDGDPPARRLRLQSVLLILGFLSDGSHILDNISLGSVLFRMYFVFSVQCKVLL